MRRVFVPTILLATAALPAFGQSAPAQPAQTLDEVVVSASRIEQSRRQVGSSVTVITAEDIARSQAVDAIDVLRRVPGLTLNQAGPQGGNVGVYLRGGESYQALVLIDGVEVSDPSGVRSTFEFANLQAADIERIEVLRGPQSVLYGSDALSGVIDIRTKRGARGLRGTATAEIGSQGTNRQAAGLSGGTERIAGALNLSRIDTNGFSAADESDGNGEADGYTNRSVSGSLGLKATDDLSFDVSARLSDGESDTDSFDFFTNSFVDAPGGVDLRAYSLRGAGTLESFGDRLTSTLSASRSDTRRHDTSGGMDSRFEGRRDKGEYLGTFKVTEDASLLFGGAVERERAISDGRTVGDVTTRSLFGEVVVSPIEPLTLTIGGRTDDHEAFGRFSTYRLTGAYSFDSTDSKLRAAIGTGFRAPALDELFGRFGTFVYGNPDLRPEQSRSVEIGIDQGLGDWGDASLTLFANRVEDFIGFGAFRYEQVAETQARGLEASFALTPFEAATLNATYSFVRAENRRTGAELLRRPRHSGSLSLGYQFTPELAATLRGRAVSARRDVNGEAGGYAVADVLVDYELSETWRLFGRVENLADRDYEELRGYGSRGRSVFAGIAATF